MSNGTSRARIDHGCDRPRFVERLFRELLNAIFYVRPHFDDLRISFALRQKPFLILRFNDLDLLIAFFDELLLPIESGRSPIPYENPDFVM